MDHEGLDWLYLCYGGLDLAAINLTGAYAALGQFVKGVLTAVPPRHLPPRGW
jgi:hypothetical protein